MVHCVTELKPFAPAQSCYNRKRNIYRKHSRDVNTLHGLWTELRSIPKAQPKREEISLKLVIITTTRNHTWWYHIYRWLSESLKKVCSRHGVQVYFNGGNTIKNLPMASKDQDPIQKKSEVISGCKCDRVDCDEEYIGESSRVFGERFKEHQKAPSPIFDHFNTTGHSITIDNFSIVGREDKNLNRAIKEALFIRVNNPSLNRNIGKLHLPHIWDEVLFNTVIMTNKRTLFMKLHNFQSISYQCPIIHKFAKRWEQNCLQNRVSLGCLYIQKLLLRLDNFSKQCTVPFVLPFGSWINCLNPKYLCH